MSELIYIIAWFILPLIPAFLLFKYLPSTGQVETPGATGDGEKPKKAADPLRGMGIKFGGAFAGYLVLFLVSKEVLNDRMKKHEEIKESNEIWTIKGDIVSLDRKYNAQDEKPAIKMDPVKQTIRDRSFDASVIVDVDGKGYLNFPMLDFITTTYEIEPLPDLDFNKTTRNIDISKYIIESFESRIIKLKKPLVLQPANHNAIQIPPGDEISVDTSFSNN